MDPVEYVGTELHGADAIDQRTRTVTLFDILIDGFDYVEHLKGKPIRPTSQGSTTGWHTHNCDQVLIVTSGSGMVANEQEQREINVGDVVHIKAGERHWHGAKANTTMDISRSPWWAARPLTDRLRRCRL